MVTIFPSSTRVVATLGMAILVMVVAGRWCLRATAIKSKDTIECARRDVQLLISIESHGEANNVAADKLGDAFLDLIKARAACAAGHVSEALEIYDQVAVALAQAVRK